jgi:Flp pilus assembly pilin Flp
MISKKPMFSTKYLSNQKGQSVLEYIILTSLIGIFCLVGVKTFGERLKTRIDHINKQVSRHITLR